ncbi:hypothetical protein CCACVL1_19958 [Corchorus capsularis]|uniref:Uncharacterized protein n=1 Tax=Corchorus capsularis TaxID=210143 RepID=A0A1R3HDS0_COCAP|nr:hypothetical protein CCACVL1_19958 [Corchorus capsularis]
MGHYPGNVASIDEFGGIKPIGSL